MKMPELEAFHELITEQGMVELERHGALSCRSRLVGWWHRRLGFPIGKQRRAALVRFLELLQRDHAESASELKTLAGLSIENLDLSVTQLRVVFDRISQLAVERPSPEHFIEATDVLSEVVGRVMNGTLTEVWVQKAASRFQALGLSSNTDEYLVVVARTACEDQASGRGMSVKDIGEAISKNDVLQQILAPNLSPTPLISRLVAALNEVSVSGLITDTEPNGDQ